MNEMIDPKEQQSPSQFGGRFEPALFDMKAMAVLRAIGPNQLRAKEAYIESEAQGLTSSDVQYALGALLEGRLIKRVSNGFDCVYVLTELGRNVLAKIPPQ